VARVARMSEEEATAIFQSMRFWRTNGEPYCPRCACQVCYTYRCRPRFKCKVCEHQFTLTSGTLFSSRKMSFRDILLGIIVFLNGANGHSALHLSQDLGCNYKTAYVLLNKLREAFAAMRPSQLGTNAEHVELDGVYIGGYIKPANRVENRIDLRKVPHPKRRSLVTMLERGPRGRAISVVLNSESDAYWYVRQFVSQNAKLRSDQGEWGPLGGTYADLKTVNHDECYFDEGTHINCVESFNSSVRRAERIYGHIAGTNAQGFADECAWRYSHRRVDKKSKFELMLMAVGEIAASATWTGYWQRRTGYLWWKERYRAWQKTKLALTYQPSIVLEVLPERQSIRV
jgi:transposase-like protein